MVSWIGTAPGPTALVAWASETDGLSTPTATPPAPTVFRNVRRLKPDSSFLRRAGIRRPLVRRILQRDLHGPEPGSTARLGVANQWVAGRSPRGQIYTRGSV